MSKLQNNYTTPEQSKRLLELGLPANSADCYYDSFNVLHWRNIRVNIFELYNDYMPCWSVGRLMEIYLICKTNNAMGLHFSENDDWDEEITEGMCDLFSAAVRCGYIDFSKLEE